MSNDKPNNPPAYNFNEKMREQLATIKHMGEFISFEKNMKEHHALILDYGGMIKQGCDNLISLCDEWGSVQKQKTEPTLLDLYAKDAPEVPDWFEIPNLQKNSRASVAYKQDRYISWRFYYATAMLKEREKHI